VEQSVIHVSGDSISSNDGASDRSLSHDITPAHRDLVSNSASTSLELIDVVHDHLRHEVRVSVPRVYPTGVRGEWILSLDRSRDQDGVPAWTTTDRDIHLYIHWDGNEPTAGNRGRLFSMPSTSGIVYEENVGETANSSNMRMEYEGAGVSMGLHRARVVDAHVEYEPHSGTFSIEAVVDEVPQGPITLNIGSGLYTYDDAASLYDSATYAGAGRNKAYTPLPIAANGRAVVTKFVYVGQERMKVFTHAYGIVPEVKPTQVGGA
jgi:hypothetical protein